MGNDEVVECEVQLAPGGCEWAALDEVRWERRIEQSEAARQDPAMCLGEQEGDAASEWHELVPV